MSRFDVALFALPFLVFPFHFVCRITILSFPRFPFCRSEDSLWDLGESVPVILQIWPAAPEIRPIGASRDLATLAGISAREISLLAPEILTFLMTRAREISTSGVGSVYQSCKG